MKIKMKTTQPDYQEIAEELATTLHALKIQHAHLLQQQKEWKESQAKPYDFIGNLWAFCRQLYPKSNHR